MPFLPYPDIPSVPGVPPLPQLPPGITSIPTISTLAAGLVLEAADSVALDVTPTWAITDTSGNTLLSPDSVIEFEYRAEMKIPTYPVEGGSFASYNKVPMPYDARMTVACNGNGEMTRETFLLAVEDLRESLETIVIVTPDAIYDSVNLVHFDYRRESRQGVTLLLVQLWFQEIRIAIQPKNKTAQPDGADPSQNGQVSPVNPTTSQQAAINTTMIV